MAEDTKDISEATMRAAFEEFLSEWRTLPPLVRAGYAYALTCKLNAETDMRKQDASIATVWGMPRRSQVERSFLFAHRVVHKLMVALANEGDRALPAAFVELTIDQKDG